MFHTFRSSRSEVSAAGTLSKHNNTVVDYNVFYDYLLYHPPTSRECSNMWGRHIRKRDNSSNETWLRAVGCELYLALALTFAPQKIYWPAKPGPCLSIWCIFVLLLLLLHILKISKYFNLQAPQTTIGHNFRSAGWNDYKPMEIFTSSTVDYHLMSALSSNSVVYLNR